MDGSEFDIVSIGFPKISMPTVNGKESLDIKV